VIEGLIHPPNITTAFLFRAPAACERPPCAPQYKSVTANKAHEFLKFTLFKLITFLRFFLFP
tara:strand:+ start:148 stop:333 length:186 start_codon:yes stop_codon:yes gene_type:complete